MSAAVALTTPTSSRNEPSVGNYFVAVYPPFSAWDSSQIPSVLEVLQIPVSAIPLGLYVHVPFCHKKCDYCYYLSYVGQPAWQIDSYVDSVVDELELYARRPAVAGRPVSFVYFGGGTPSTLSEAQVRRLGCGLRNILSWQDVQEITFECAPRSVRSNFLATLKALGVTRLSLGVQSFDNTLLKLSGRVHLRHDILNAFAEIQSVGFEQINLDLMVGLPGETSAHWKDSIRQVIDLNPESVTIYQTEIPGNTQLYRDLKNSCVRAALVSWDEKRERLLFGFQELQRAGYTLVSAYTAVKNPKRHRFIYQQQLWRGADMLGLGVASFSYFQGVHFQNAVTLDSYRTLVGQGALPLQRAFLLSDRDRLIREFILQLKLGEVNTADLAIKFGVDVKELFQPALRSLEKEGMLTVSPAGVRLTSRGLLRVDRLVSHWYDPEFQGVRYT